MADTRINALSTATVSLSDDFLPIDGTTAGTKKLSAYNPSFGGNATVGGTLTVTGATSVAANLKSSVSSSGSTGGILLAENTAAAATGNQASVFLPTSTGASTYWQLIGRQNSSTANDQTLRVVFGGVAQHTYFNASDLSTQSGITLKVLDTTASTTTSSGALVVGNGTSGGLGVGGAATIGGVVKGAQNTHSDANVPTGLSAGFQVDVEAATTRDILTFGDSARHGLIRGYQDGSGTIHWRFGRYTASTFAEYVRIAGLAAADAVVSIYGTTASTSTSSGALVVGGGVGVAGAIYAGARIQSAVDLVVDAGSGSANAVLYLAGRNSGTQNLVTLTSNFEGALTITPKAGQGTTIASSLTTAAPSGGTAAAWKLGTVASVSPTSPDRTIEVDIGGTIYYIHAKTTNN
jgi:hypothetical protein